MIIYFYTNKFNPFIAYSFLCDSDCHFRRGSQDLSSHCKIIGLEITSSRFVVDIDFFYCPEDATFDYKQEIYLYPCHDAINLVCQLFPNNHVSYPEG